jgi:hypothetical protein
VVREVKAGTAVRVLLMGGPVGLVGTLEVRMKDPVSGVVAVPATTVGIVEISPPSGNYATDFAIPASTTPGDYVIEWINGTTEVLDEDIYRITAPVAVPTPTPPAPDSELGWLRRLMEDAPAVEVETAVGDGVERLFLVRNPPMTATSEVVTVNGATQDLGTDYTITAEADGVLFVTAPPLNATVTIQYSRQSFTDDELTQYLTQAALDYTSTRNRVYQAAIYAIDALMVGAATALNWGAGAESFDMVSVWERLQRIRELFQMRLEVGVSAESSAFVLQDMYFGTHEDETF